MFSCHSKYSYGLIPTAKLNFIISHFSSENFAKCQMSFRYSENKTRTGETMLQ